MVLDIQRIQLKNYSENKCLDQYRDFNSFYIEYLGESFLNPVISFPVIKTFYPIQVIDLRFQIDYITPKSIRLFGEYETALKHTTFYVILMEHKEIKMVSYGNKITGIELVWELNDSTYFRRFYEEINFERWDYEWMWNTKTL